MEIDIALHGQSDQFGVRYVRVILLGPIMKNRAKCKLCASIIESFHDLDYVSCKCGHISVSGGDNMECSAIDWNNFFRVDDQGNEIVVTVKDDNVKPLYKEKLDREDLLKMLEDMIKHYENLPQNVLNAPITGYDLTSFMLLVSSLFRV